MREDEVARSNRRHWDRMVREGCGYTVPWLDLDRERIADLGAAPPSGMPELGAVCSFVRGMNLANRDVLCLASGGGQQSAVFGLLGARVTVVDIAEGQLDGDRRAAAHYGYDVRTVRADMRDLSCLDANGFDLVYGTVLCYVPDVRTVFAQVARVLRFGGLYRTDAHQPAVHSVDWDGRKYCVGRAYADRSNTRDDGAIEFRHYMDDLFSGLIDAGFSILRVEDLARDWQPVPDAGWGTWAHQEPYIGGQFSILARNGNGAATQDLHLVPMRRTDSGEFHQDG